jgi:hypothetical protein
VSLGSARNSMTAAQSWILSHTRTGYRPEGQFLRGFINSERDSFIVRVDERHQSASLCRFISSIIRGKLSY